MNAYQIRIAYSVDILRLTFSNHLAASNVYNVHLPEVSFESAWMIRVISHLR